VPPNLRDALLIEACLASVHRGGSGHHSWEAWKVTICGIRSQAGQRLPAHELALTVGCARGWRQQVRVLL